MDSAHRFINEAAGMPKSAHFELFYLKYLNISNVVSINLL